MEIHVSAPGKVILHGEHSVVYGKVAVAASLNLRCHLTLKTETGTEVLLDLPDVNVHKSFPVSSIHKRLQDVVDAGPVLEPSPASDEMITFLKKCAGLDASNTETKHLAITAFLYIYYNIFKSKRDLPAISLCMKSELPVGAGLGSSAAFSVTTSAALLQLAGHIQSQKQDDGMATWSYEDRNLINKWAFIGEKIIHGRPSGIDNSISTFGGAIRFQNGNITFINDMPTLPVMLVNTKVPRSTMVLVAGLRDRYNLYPEIFEPVFEAVDAIAKRAESVYKSLHGGGPSSDNYRTLGDLIDLNQQMLSMMGVSHSSLDHIVAVARRHGFHSKLTGAGGGGCAFVLIPPDSQEISQQRMKGELQELGLEVWAGITVGGQGVVQHL